MSWYLCSTSESCQKSSMVTQRDAKGENTDAREVDYVRVVQVKHFLSCCRATTHRSLGTEPCHRPFPVVYRCVGAARPRDVRPPFRPALRLLASNSSSYTFAFWRSIFSLSFHRTLVFFYLFQADDIQIAQASLADVTNVGSLSLDHGSLLGKSLTCIRDARSAFFISSVLQQASRSPFYYFPLFALALYHRTSPHARTYLLRPRRLGARCRAL